MISGGRGELKRPIRAATGERPVINAVREGTHCGAAVNARSKTMPSRANWSRCGRGHPVGAIGAQIRGAMVVGKDKEDVGRAAGLGGCGERRGGQSGQKLPAFHVHRRRFSTCLAALMAGTFRVYQATQEQDASTRGLRDGRQHPFVCAQGLPPFPFVIYKEVHLSKFLHLTPTPQEQRG